MQKETSLKNTITYILIFFVSLVFNYETIEYFSKLTNTSIACLDHIDCEEKESSSEESEESKEKTEKLDFFEDLLQRNNFVSSYLKSPKTLLNQSINFCSSDYSQVIYSPPENI